MSSLREGRIRRNNKSIRQKTLAKNFSELLKQLMAIDRDEEIHGYTDEPQDVGTADRRAAIAALDVVQDFLHSTGPFVSATLYQLKLDLKAVEHPGETRSIFKPARVAGRKPDSRTIEMLKGMLAGMAYAKMACGMSRDQAANWVARNVPPALAKKISSKPIHGSSVKEWMYHHGSSARVRRDLKSSFNKREGFRNFLGAKFRSKQTEGTFGELYCLSGIWSGLVATAAGKKISFEDLTYAVQSEFTLEILADLSPNAGK